MVTFIYTVLKLLNVKKNRYELQRLAYDVAYGLSVRWYLVWHGKVSVNKAQATWAKPLPVALARQFHPITALDTTWQLLTNNQAAFSIRHQLIENAKKTIHISTYILRHDTTGQTFLDVLAKKAKAGVQVKLLLDKIELETELYANPAFEVCLQFMRQHNITYQLSGNAQVYQRNHGKLFIIDDSHLIIGGRNYSDHYSQPGWRDLELFTEDKAAVQAASNLFQAMWQDPSFKQVSDTMTGSSPLLMQLPSVFPSCPIMQQLLSDIQSAKQSIDIENAYFINFPVLNTALIAARQRGVKVRIFTNSLSSNDLPHNGIAMLGSFITLEKHNIPVYLRQGDQHHTLHSKYCVIDQYKVCIGSYNLSGFSARFCFEVNLYIHDTPLAKALTAYFETGIAEAQAFSAKIHLKPIRFWRLKKMLSNLYIDLC